MTSLVYQGVLQAVYVTEIARRKLLGLFAICCTINRALQRKYIPSALLNYSIKTSNNSYMSENTTPGTRMPMDEFKSLCSRVWISDQDLLNQSVGWKVNEYRQQLSKVIELENQLFQERNVLWNIQHEFNDVITSANDCIKLIDDQIRALESLKLGPFPTTSGLTQTEIKRCTKINLINTNVQLRFKEMLSNFQIAKNLSMQTRLDESTLKLEMNNILLSQRESYLRCVDKNLTTILTNCSTLLPIKSIFFSSTTMMGLHFDNNGRGSNKSTKETGLEWNQLRTTLQQETAVYRRENERCTTLLHNYSCLVQCLLQDIKTICMIEALPVHAPGESPMLELHSPSIIKTHWKPFDISDIIEHYVSTGGDSNQKKRKRVATPNLNQQNSISLSNNNSLDRNHQILGMLNQRIDDNAHIYCNNSGLVNTVLNEDPLCTTEFDEQALAQFETDFDLTSSVNDSYCVTNELSGMIDKDMF